MMQPAKQFRLNTILPALLAAWCAESHGLGLGNVSMHSNLGRPLQVTVSAHGVDEETQSSLCIRSRLESFEGKLLAMPQAVSSRSGGVTSLDLRTRENIDEPAVRLFVEIGCNTSIRREYQLLLDPASEEALLQPMAAAEHSATASEELIANAVARPAKTRSRRQPVKTEALDRPPAAVRRPAKQAAKSQNVLRLSASDQVVSSIPQTGAALEGKEIKPGPRTGADPAKLETTDTNKALAAIAPANEQQLLAAEARAQEAQARMRAMQREVIKAKEQSAVYEQELEKERQQRNWLFGWLASLAALLLGAAAAIAWLIWRHAKQSRAVHQAFVDYLASDNNMEQPEATAPLDSWLAVPRPAVMPIASMVENANVESFAVASSEEQPTFPIQEQPLPEDLSMPRILENLDFQVHWHDEDDPAVQSVTPDKSDADAEVKRIAEAEMALGQADDQAWMTLPGPMFSLAKPDEKPVDGQQVSELLLAVEAWMADHNPMRAVEILEPYCGSDDQSSIAPALYLLELYRILHNEQKYWAFSEDTARRFATTVPALEDQLVPASPVTLADFPEITEEINRLDGSGRVRSYLQELLVGDRHFDFSTYRDIMHRLSEASDFVQKEDTADMSLDFHHS
jgi:pilus assembly protein FimV